MNAPLNCRFPRLHPFFALLAAGAWLGGIAPCAWADQVVVDCRLGIVRRDATLNLSWHLPLESSANLFLQSASSPSGPWSTISNAQEPFELAPTLSKDSFFRAGMALPSGSPDAAQIAQSVRAFAFASNPGLNPSAQFEIRLAPVRGLWETMQIQVANVRCLSADGQLFNQFACVLRGGALQTLGRSVGGHGLMSGLVRDDTFYFTYSWGSGVHRSHVGKLQIVNSEAKFWDSGALFGGLLFRDVFVSRRPDGEIALFKGSFQSFNRWQLPVEVGVIDRSDPAAPKIVDLDGGVLATLIPAVY